jgi:hypothetical protein
MTRLSSNSLVASAARITDAPKMSRRSSTAAGWQARAWEFYDLVGEFRYAADWVGSMLSKAELQVHDASGARQTSGRAVELLAELYGGPSNQGRMLNAFGIHLTVAGEYYVLGTTRKGRDVWVTAAPGELTARGGSYYLDGKKVESDDTPFVSRNWRPHPKKHTDAIAPSRAVLPILAEIDGLTRHVAAQIDSRLAGAGLLILPNELKFPRTPSNTPEGATSQESGDLDEFIKLLTEAMSAAIADREAASALVPITITVPGEYVDKANLVKFWSDLDEHAIELRTEAIRRLGLGLDMPPEVLTGSGDLNHWNAWAVDDAAIKVHAEPALDLICADLTEGYLRPLLIDEGYSAEEAEEFHIAADTTGIRLRPNRSSEALDLWDRGLLNDAAARKETGFDDDDALNSEQQVLYFLRKVASGSTTPELVAQALGLLGVQGLEVVETDVEPTEARPAPSLTDLERAEPGIPDTMDDAQVASAQCRADLLAASEQMVYRALERAGNRLKTKLNGSRPPGVAAAELYLLAGESVDVEDLLTDAWSHVDRFCPELGCQPTWLAGVLDAYTRQLLSTRAPYDRDQLQRYLTLAREEA